MQARTARSPEPGHAWRFDGFEIFSALCREHIALEESLIYPQARARMAACERQAMNREMAQRRRRALQARAHG